MLLAYCKAADRHELQPAHGSAEAITKEPLVGLGGGGLAAGTAGGGLAASAGDSGLGLGLAVSSAVAGDEGGGGLAAGTAGGGLAASAGDSGLGLGLAVSSAVAGDEGGGGLAAGTAGGGLPVSSLRRGGRSNRESRKVRFTCIAAHLTGVTKAAMEARMLLRPGWHSRMRTCTMHGEQCLT